MAHRLHTFTECGIRFWSVLRELTSCWLGGGLPALASLSSGLQATQLAIPAGRHLMLLLRLSPYLAPQSAPESDYTGLTAIWEFSKYSQC